MEPSSDSQAQHGLGKFGDHPPLSEKELDRLLSDYLVIHESGKDPFGVVFRARHRKLQRLVSIRVLDIPADAYPGGAAEFCNYIGAFARYHHPHLAEISDFGATETGHLYVVTSPSESRLEPGPLLEMIGVTTVFQQLLTILSWLHQNGVYHGWLHPNLISLDAVSGVKVDGIGVAGLAGLLGPRLNLAPLIPFLAPEHSKNLGSSTAGDLYSVGVCLYAVLTGNLPQGFFQLPSAINPAVGDRFDTAIIRALQSDPGSRFANAMEFAAAMEDKSRHVSNRGAKTSLAGARRPVLAMGDSAVKASVRVGKRTPAISKGELKEQPHSHKTLVGIAAAALVVAVVCVIGFLKLNKKDEAGSSRRTPTAESVPDSPVLSKDEEEEPVPEPGGLDQEHLGKLSTLLADIRLLYPHSENLRALVDRNRGLLSLLGSSGELDAIVISSDDPDFVNFIMSAELMAEVKSIYDDARLSRPERPGRAGTLVGWTGTAGSEDPVRELLPDYEGDFEGIVAVSGSLEAGIALTVGGTLASWGEWTKPPAQLPEVVAIDCGAGTCIALKKDGSAEAWGISGPPGDETKAWKDITGVSAGRSHVIAVTESFEVLVAGSNEAGQSEVPESVNELKVFSVEAVGDYSYAIGVDGRFVRWGGGEPEKKGSLYLPIEVNSSQSNLYARSQNGEIHRIDKYGEKSELDLGLEKPESFLPRLSPDERIFAFNVGSSRWSLKIDGSPSIDEAYFQEVSRGAIDLILGNDRFIGVVPRVSNPEKVTESDQRKPVRMSSVDGIPVAEAQAFREWSVGDGEKRRARLVEVRDGTHFVLEFPDKSRGTFGGEILSEEDRKFSEDWIPDKEIIENRVSEILASMSADEVLERSGYKRIEMEMRDGDPHVVAAINERDGAFVVDTGATATVIRTALADSARIELSEGPYMLTWQGRVKTYKGEAKSLSIGGLVDLSNVKLHAMEIDRDRTYDGLIGIDVLKSGRAVLDFGRSELLFRVNPTTASANPAEKFEDEFRTWTSKQGSTIRARYTESGDGDKISIKTADGTARDVPRELLGELDLEYLCLRELHLRQRDLLGESLKNLTIDHYLYREPGTWSNIDVSMAGNTPVIKVVLDGRSLEFFIDTGASSSMLSIEAAKTLGLDIDSLPIVGRSAGLEGRFLPVRAADFDSFGIGSKILHDYRLRVYDFKNMTENRFSGSPRDGVIGTDLLIQLGALYDTGGNRLFVPAR